MMAYQFQSWNKIILSFYEEKSYHINMKERVNQMYSERIEYLKKSLETPDIIKDRDAVTQFILEVQEKQIKKLSRTFCNAIMSPEDIIQQSYMLLLEFLDSCFDNMKTKNHKYNILDIKFMSYWYLRNKTIQKLGSSKRRQYDSSIYKINIEDLDQGGYNVSYGDDMQVKIENKDLREFKIRSRRSKSVLINNLCDYVEIICNNDIPLLNHVRNQQEALIRTVFKYYKLCLNNYEKELA